MASEGLKNKKIQMSRSPLHFILKVILFIITVGWVGGESAWGEMHICGGLSFQASCGLQGLSGGLQA